MRINIDENNVYLLSSIADTIIDNGWDKNPLFDAYIYPLSYSGNVGKKYYKGENELYRLVLNEFNKNNRLEEIFNLDFHGLNFLNILKRNEFFLPQKKFCASCESQLVVDSNNKIYTCWWGAYNKEFEVGYIDNNVHINEEKLDVWRNHNVNNIISCVNCRYKYICGAGCVFKSYIKKQNLNSGNCSPFYENIRNSLEFEESKKDIEYLINLIIKQIVINYINEYKIMRIKAVGNSMIPTIKSDEYVIFEKQKNYSMNDIILYFSNNQFKIHRIIKLKERNFFTVKGDNETYREDIHLDDIIGVLNRNSVLEQNEKQYLLTVNKYQIKVYFKNHTLKDIAINEKYY